MEHSRMRGFLQGLEHALRAIAEELNEQRAIIGLPPVTIVGLGGEASRPKTTGGGGITPEGREKLRQLMRDRWKRAKGEPSPSDNHPAKKKPKG